MTETGPEEGQRKQAMITTLRLLAATPKSRFELTRRLREKGYAESVILQTLDELEKKGFLSDRAFAENLKSRFTLGKPSGSKKIAFELKRHGVPPQIREEVMSGLEPEEEMARAREIGMLRWNQHARLAPEKRKKRVYDFLLRRGFDYSIARDLIEEFERCHEG